MKIKLMYKIHSLVTAQEMSRSAGNDTFYETYDEALEQARSYVTRSESSTMMVIYKAHVLIRAEHPPVEVMSINRHGDCVAKVEVF